MNKYQEQLESYTELHWWNMGSKTLSYQGTLKGLLDLNNVSYRRRKSEHDGLYNFYFRNNHGIAFKCRGLLHEFSHYAKQFMQMELVRMGDKAQLYVECSWRRKVTVNF